MEAGAAVTDNMSSLEPSTPPQVAVQPPLPPAPPPLPRSVAAAREAHNPQYQAAAIQAAHMLAAEAQPNMMPNGFMPGFQPPLPLQQQPLQQPMHHQWSYQSGMEMPGMPPISAMLMREADAWRALMSLHGSVVSLSRNISIASSSSEEGDPGLEEQREASDQREASYLASLAQLMAHCDGMVNEVVKLRGLRKSKHQLEIQALREVLRNHSDEIMAMGDGMARNAAMNMASAASEMRQAAQSLRTQITQARGVIQVAAEVRALGKVDLSSTIVMGWADCNGETKELRPVSKILEQVYQRGQLNEDNLRAAIYEGDLERPEVPAARTFSRRSGDRALQLQQVASEPVSL